MAYHDLSSCTLSANERLAEVQKLLSIIPKDAQMTEQEEKFVKFIGGATFCSVKQLFWLRDIKDKYL